MSPICNKGGFLTSIPLISRKNINAYDDANFPQNSKNRLEHPPISKAKIQKTKSKKFCHTVFCLAGPGFMNLLYIWYSFRKQLFQILKVSKNTMLESPVRKVVQEPLELNSAGLKLIKPERGVGGRRPPRRREGALQRRI